MFVKSRTSFYVSKAKFTPRGISLPKISYTFGKNPFVFKKNPSKIGINPFVRKKSRTLFPMSEVPLGSHQVVAVAGKTTQKAKKIEYER